jgi:hypothetical protein
MNIKYGKGKTEFGPGVEIKLTGNDVAIAIHAYLVAHNYIVIGPRTVTVNGEMCEYGKVYVDPSGKVIADGKEYNGRGPEQDKGAK